MQSQAQAFVASIKGRYLLPKAIVISFAFFLSSLANATCSYTISNEWSTGYTATITVTNSSASAVSAWSLAWKYSTNKITGSWNAILSGTNPYTVTNASWNGALGANQSTTFGVQVDKLGGSAEVPVLSGGICSSGAVISSSTSAAATSMSSSSKSSQSSVSSTSSVVQSFATNGGVESGLTNWGAIGGTLTRSTSIFRSGLASAYISGRTASWNGLTFSVGSLTTGNQYSVAVWVKLAPNTPDSVISLTAKRYDDSDTATYNEFTRVATVTASANEWRLLQGYYTQLGSTGFQYFIIEGADATTAYYADDFSIAGEVSSSSSSSTSSQACDIKAPLSWTSSGPLISPNNSAWASIKDPSVVKYNGTYYIYATYYDTSYKSMNMKFTNWSTAQAATQNSMNGTLVGNTVAPQVFYFAPQKKWYLITQWPGSYSTTTDIANPNWTAKQKLLQNEPSGALDFWVICNDTHCYLYFSRDDGVLYMSKTTIANFPNFSGYSIVMEDHRGNGSNYLFEASNVYKLDGQNKYLLMVEAYMSGPRLFRSWTSSSLDGPWTALADTETNPFAGNNNVEWPSGKWANGISHGELIRSGYDEKMTIDPCNIQFLYQGQAGTGATYDLVPYKLGLLTLKK